jgi:amidase
MNRVTESEFCAMSLREMASAIRRRELSAREALEAHLWRIAAVNPTINAVVTLDEEGARRRAEEADELTASGAQLGPLHGVPMTHKDSHETAGLRTTLGSALFADNVPTRDALIVRRLKDAGVVTTGKTNVPELAAGSHTFNNLFGTTTNPYDPTKSAGGSSGGVAAAIAAGIQPAGDGSDMGGSIRTPSSFCNITGLRPSAGRLPAWPASDPWAWISRKGPMAREVADLAYLMTAIAGPDERIPTSLAEPPSVFGRPLAHDLTGLRLAWTPDLGLKVPVEREVLDVLEAQLHHFESLGATVELACPDLSDADEVFGTTRALDFLVSYGDLYQNNPGMFKESLRWNLDKGLALTGPAIASSLIARGRLLRQTTTFFETYDVLLAPAVQVLPFDARLEYPRSAAGEEFSTYLDWMRAATVISATGLPAMSVPAGFSAGGLPVGLQLVGRDRGDMQLLDVAHAFEQANPVHRRRPDL